MSIFTITEHFQPLAKISAGIAKRGVGGIFTGASEVALKQASEKALKEASEVALKEASEKALKEASEKALKQATEEASEKALKEATEEATEKAAKESAEEAAEKAAKEALEKGGKEAGGKAAEKASKKTLTETFNDGYQKALQKIKDNPITSGLILVGGLTLGGLAIAAKVKSDEINNSTYNITSIENASASGKILAKILFSPGQSVSLKDTVSFVETDSDPALPSINCEIHKMISDSEILVVIPNKIIKSGTTGNMKIHTDPDNQFKKILKETAKDIGETIGETAGGAAEGLGGAAEGILGGIWDGLGLPDLTQYWWVLLIICILCVSSSAIPIIIKFM